MANEKPKNDLRPRIVVVGSIKMNRLPKPGETVTGESFQTISGGKGANQAVAAVRLGGRVSMIGRVGDDSFGVSLRKNLSAAGVETDHVSDTPGVSSGVALIGVEQSGANSITVVPAANGRLTAADVSACEKLIATANALIVQLETPIETVAAAIQIAKQNGVLTVLDPAPAPSESLPQELMVVDILSPNQSEAEALTGIAVIDWESAKRAAQAMINQGANDIVLKMGALGALVYSRDGSMYQVSARRAEIVDTTAAGDAFTAALTVALCEGLSLENAANFGSLAGTLACTRFGAQPAMPSRDELTAFAESSNVIS
jgi:ribokinase